MPEPVSTGTTPGNYPVREFTNLSVFIIPPWPIIEKVVQDLMEDYDRRIARGERHQIVPGIVAPNIALPGKYDIGDFLHRFEAARRKGLSVWAEVRPNPFARGEVNRIRASSLLKRKKVGPYELADIVTAHKLEMGFETWDETATDLIIPPPTLSSILCVKRIPPDLRPLTNGFGPRLLQCIARVSKRADMEKVIAYAKSDGAEPVKVENVELFVKREIKGNKPSGRKPGQIKGKKNSPIERLAFQAEAKHDSIVRELKSIIDTILANKNLPIRVIIDIINGREEPPAAAVAMTK